jgi:hypothetical protein
VTNHLSAVRNFIFPAVIIFCDVDVRVSAQLSGGQYDAEAGKINNTNSNLLG